MKRKANARWSGGLKDGQGVFSTSSGSLSDVRYSVPTRFGDEPGTNPEELIAAAHAACFSMALSGTLGGAGLAPQRIDTQATLTLEKLEPGWTVTAIHLDVSASIPDADPKVFQECAEKAVRGCPISRLLRTEITMDAKLA
jgi:osmotically inducible protein OsmC